MSQFGQDWPLVEIPAVVSNHGYKLGPDMPRMPQKPAGKTGGFAFARSRILANFESERLKFRRLTPSDAGPDWTNWLSDPVIADGLNVPTRHLSVSDLRNYIASFDQDRRNLIGIFEKQSGKLAGLFMVEIDRRHDNANCHIVIGEKRLLGRRIGYEAGEALVHHCFRTWKLEKVMFCPLANNVPAIIVCLAHHLDLEGIFRDHRKVGSGARVDQLQYAITRAEYDRRVAERRSQVMDPK